MLQKKNNLLALAFIFSGVCPSVIAESLINGDSGEVIAMDAVAPLQSDQMIIKTSAGNFQLTGLPFVKKEHLITRHSQDIRVQFINFGESRITIADNSKVTLSKEDQSRATKEALEIKKALSQSTLEFTPSFNFIAPVPGAITSPFGKQRFINGLARSPHLALDLRGAVGTSIVAPLKGKVVLVGDFFYTGHTLILDHGYGLFSSYAHMSEVSAEINSFVEQSQLIGLVGKTGRVTGPHLHWTVYFDGNKVNPESLIKKDYLASILQAAKDRS